MEKVYDLNGYRMIDLSKILDPATETRRCKLYRFNTGGAIPDYHTNMDLMSHLGTHCECPYHHDNKWPSVADLPLSTFMGRAIYIDITGLPPRTYITADILDKWCKPFMKDGTIVILDDSDYRITPFTSLTNTDMDKRLLVNGETATWFKDHKAKCVGFGEGVSIENRNEDVKPFHDILMAENVVFLEVLQNLELLKSKVFFMSYSPLPIKDLDSSPVRAYAIEGLPGFTE